MGVSTVPRASRRAFDTHNPSRRPERRFPSSGRPPVGTPKIPIGGCYREFSMAAAKGRRSSATVTGSGGVKSGFRGSAGSRACATSPSPWANAASERCLIASSAKWLSQAVGSRRASDQPSRSAWIRWASWRRANSAVLGGSMRSTNSNGAHSNAERSRPVSSTGKKSHLLLAVNGGRYPASDIACSSSALSSATVSSGPAGPSGVTFFRRV